MASKANRFPTLVELRHMSNQELYDKKLTSMTPAQAGTVRT